MRLVDADALIERLKFKREMCDIDNKKHAGLDCAISQISKAPTVQVMGEWISVEERLPVIQGKYLVYTYDRRMFMCDLIDHYCDGNLQFDDYRVTHWMPLPQPPQKKGE